MKQVWKFALITVGYYLIVVGATFSFLLVVMKLSTVRDTFSPQQGLAAGLFGLLIAYSFLRLAAVRVGYRTTDALLIFVPLLNIYFVLKVLWRVAALPERYWVAEG